MIHLGWKPGTRPADEWTAWVDLVEADVGIAYHQEIEAVRAKEAAVQQKLEELKRAGEGATEDIKAGFETAWQNLRTAFDAAAKRFK